MLRYGQRHRGWLHISLRSFHPAFLTNALAAVTPAAAVVQPTLKHWNVLLPTNFVDIPRRLD
ncbi:hypothetical protein BwSG20_52680 [Bradyrhizobium ottawaense]|nr:hypothetical protein BwSG20_52680 [Bradyrhizobium ottawaense]